MFTGRIALLVVIFSTTVHVYGAEKATGFGGLPMSFEANQGQTNAQVRYLARGAGYMLFLTPSEAVLRVMQSRTSSAVLRMQLIGGRASAIAGAEGAGKSNYFLDSDPRHWHTGIPNYRAVAYRGLHKGVDLIFYGKAGHLDFDYVIAPDGNPREIVTEYRGADELTLDESGNLLIRFGKGVVTQVRPRAYQKTADGRQEPVVADYVLLGAKRVGLKLAVYDHSRELVIDPILKYSTFLGGADGPSGAGTGFTSGNGIAVDSTGHAYVTGETQSTDFPVTSGAYDTTSAGGGPVVNGAPMGVAFVTKMNATGTGLIYSTYIGGNGISRANAITVDGSGNAYITGHTANSNYPTTPGAFQTTFEGQTCDGSDALCEGDAFVTKLNASGSALVFSTFLGGTDYDEGTAIAVDGSGNVYVTGATESTDFPVKNAFQPTINSDPNCYPGHATRCGNAFVTKLNSTGSGLIYSTYYGGSFWADGRGIAVDASGNAYVTGETSFVGLRSTRNFGGTSDGSGGYVLKVSPPGGYVWSDTIESGIGQAIAVDQYGQPFITGPTDSPRLPVTPGAFQTAPKNPPVGTAFVTKISADGTTLRYSTYLGGSNGDSGNGIRVDNQGHAYVTGTTYSTDFPVTASAFQKTGTGADGFVTMMAAAGNGLMYSTYLGPSQANAIAVDKSWNAYVTGNTASSKFPVTAGAFQPSLKGNTDAFVSKIAIVADLAITKTASATSVAHGITETYTIVVQNKGPDPAWSTTVTDALPSGTVFESVSTSMGSCTHPPVGYGGTVSCKTNFYGGTTTTWTIKLAVKITASSGAKITNKATVKSSTQDPATANNASIMTVSVQ